MGSLGYTVIAVVTTLLVVVAIVAAIWVRDPSTRKMSANFVFWKASWSISMERGQDAPPTGRRDDVPEISPSPPADGG
ncbi:hypothetical protein [Umezawaea sp. Da 62-37]|uniref:hypothetical protein n=1 Tax=Umezawaea sp. Da 62-37 TaxID=3075927 RepID=UPI0028F6E42C|nr:hypothetical protein [Umezawaea sp. Da 62-37]WNV89293.1 hypothetical protein RM788_13610 [Umezawaea sp. Da 62-37]